MLTTKRIFLAILLFYVINGNAQTYKTSTDPFAPYLTEKSPPIVRDLGEEVQDGVKIRKVVFLSRIYHNQQKSDSALIFAVVARPEKAGRYPGLLVLHGGGGCAEIEKAKKWAAQGYIVVAPDEPGVANPQKIPFSTGVWNFFKYGENRFTVSPDITHSTIFDAALASLQAFYLLHDQPDVIKNKLGITGISWGGYLSSITSGLASSIVTASFSVYGCGFYDEGTTFLKELNKMTDSDRDIWLKYLDAGRRMKHIHTPFFIAAATNDDWFYPPAVMKTLHSTLGYTNHLFAPNVSHNIPLPGGTQDGGDQKPGWLKMEQSFFDYYLKGYGQRLPEFKKIKCSVVSKGDTSLIEISFKTDCPKTINQACLYYSTVDSGWTKRSWRNQQIQRQKRGWYKTVVSTTQDIDWFITISDNRPVSVSSDMIRQKITVNK
jgi:dienelactone hydrolase